MSSITCYAYFSTSHLLLTVNSSLNLLVYTCCTGTYETISNFFPDKFFLHQVWNMCILVQFFLSWAPRTYELWSCLLQEFSLKKTKIFSKVTYLTYKSIKIKDHGLKFISVHVATKVWKNNLHLEKTGGLYYFFINFNQRTPILPFEELLESRSSSFPVGLIKNENAHGINTLQWPILSCWIEDEGEGGLAKVILARKVTKHALAKRTGVYLQKATPL